MKKTSFSMAMLGVTAAFALVTAQAQNMSNAASGTPATTTKQAASNPNAATQGGQTTTAAGMTGQSGAQGATASGAGAATLSKADQKMVRDMAMTNMAEIETARMAQSKSQSEHVKTYAQRMIDDHTKAQSDVQQLAQAKGVTLPTELDKAHKAKGAKLAKLSGEQFDKAYMAQAGVADHKKAHALLNTASKKARDPEVKALAGRIHPAVQEHLKMAQDHAGHSAGAMGASGAAGTTASGNNGNAAGMAGTADKSKDKP